MSNKLALSSAISVLMMSAFALFSPQSAHAPLGPDALVSAAHAAPATR